MISETNMGTPSFFEKLIRLVYPAKCMVCDDLLTEDKLLHLCCPCKKALPFYKGGFYYFPETPELKGLLAAFYYKDGIEKAIQDMKFRHNPRLAQTLGALLFAEIRKVKNLPGFDYIVPVPMHPIKKCRRGYNQSELLGGTLSKLMKIPLYKGLLRKIRHTKPQSLLKRDERLKNLDNSFKIKKGAEISGKNILLVDDVITTGTTLNTCAKILSENGADHIFAAVIAIA